MLCLIGVLIKGLHSRTGEAGSGNYGFVWRSQRNSLGVDAVVEEDSGGNVFEAEILRLVGGCSLVLILPGHGAPATPASVSTLPCSMIIFYE